MNTYQLPIGDWSHDGHGHCEWFTVTSDASAKEIFAAYHDSVKLHPDIDPDKICNEYGENIIDPDILEKIIAAGFNGFTHSEDDGVDTDQFVEYVVWFINLGKPSVNLTLIPKDHSNELINWTAQKEGTTFPGFGYGLFSD